jgi:hypothetical protein
MVLQTQQMWPWPDGDQEVQLTNGEGWQGPRPELAFRKHDLLYDVKCCKLLTIYKLCSTVVQQQLYNSVNVFLWSCIARSYSFSCMG